MASPTCAAESIRAILDGKKVASASKHLIQLGDTAVLPILEALTGSHGSAHPDECHRATEALLETLVAIGQRDPDHLAVHLADGTPGEHAIAWALGHSKSPHALKVIQSLADHPDGGIRGSAHFHLHRHKKKAAAGSAKGKVALTAKEPKSSSKKKKKKGTGRRR